MGIRLTPPYMLYGGILHTSESVVATVVIGCIGSVQRWCVDWPFICSSSPNLSMFHEALKYAHLKKIVPSLQHSVSKLLLVKGGGYKLGKSVVFDQMTTAVLLYCCDVIVMLCDNSTRCVCLGSARSGINF